MNSREFCFVGKLHRPEDAGLLFEPEDELLKIDEGETMAHLMFRTGKFRSVGEARRNGWGREIPSGWNVFTVGKGKNRIDVFIWNPST